ncbi:MAG: YccF domain-containing protein [Acidimicrobiia bacterium]|nr:YccF domain-containing protein [Acidimicrobiia bacterium]
MRTIGNFLWLVVAGIWLALGYAVAGIALCLTVIGIPFGIQAFKLARFSLWPFGRGVVPRDNSGGCLRTVFNVVWLVLFGWEIFLFHLLAGLVLCLTVIGIPFGLQAFKLSRLALWPFGYRITDREEAQALEGGIAARPA